MKKIFILALALAASSAFASQSETCTPAFSPEEALETYKKWKEDFSNPNSKYAEGKEKAPLIQLWKDACVIKRFTILTCDAFGEEKNVKVWTGEISKSVQQAVKASVAAVCNSYLDEKHGRGEVVAPHVVSYEVIKSGELVEYYPVILSK